MGGPKDTQLSPWLIALKFVGMCLTFQTDLEKAASGASGACGLFVGNPAILRHFQLNIPYFG